MAMMMRRRETMYYPPPTDPKTRRPTMKPKAAALIQGNFDMVNFSSNDENMNNSKCSQEESDGEGSPDLDPNLEMLRNIEMAQTDYEEPQTKMGKTVKYVRLIGPHVGLVLLLVIYLLIGATIFVSLIK
jgi:hypothetical protein